MMADKFTFEFDAMTSLYMVEALHEKAEAETAEAEELETLAFGGGPETDFNDMKAYQARNRAALLQQAADKIHRAVHAELVSNFDEAFKRQGL